MGMLFLQERFLFMNLVDKNSTLRSKAGSPASAISTLIRVEVLSPSAILIALYCNLFNFKNS